MLIEQSIERVRAYRRAMQWSINRMAHEAGMGESTIRNMDRDDWCPTAETLRKLEGIVPDSFMLPRRRSQRSAEVA